MKDILSPLIDACQWILEFWHDLIGGSWGWSIILLTFTVRIVILPLTFKGVKSMQCLPMLLQIPFFISLFYLLRSDEFQQDIAGNAGFGPIDDLAEKVTGDPVLLGVLIVLYVGTQLAATMVTAFSADPTQRRIMLALPFVFTVFIINFQAGLIVYWITTNVWTIGQQLLVKKLYPKPERPDAAGASDSAKP